MLWVTNWSQWSRLWKTGDFLVLRIDPVAMEGSVWDPLTYKWSKNWEGGQPKMYLEPVCPLFWWLNPSKQGRFQSKQGSFGFQVPRWDSSKSDLFFSSDSLTNRTSYHEIHHHEIPTIWEHMFYWLSKHRDQAKPRHALFNHVETIDLDLAFPGCSGLGGWGVSHVDVFCWKRKYLEDHLR